MEFYIWVLCLTLMNIALNGKHRLVKMKDNFLMSLFVGDCSGACFREFTCSLCDGGENDGAGWVS
jgi:hypothetical protein